LDVVLVLLPGVVDDMLLPSVEPEDAPGVEFMLPLDGIDMPGDIVPDPPVDGIAPVLPDCAPIAPLVDWEPPIAPDAPAEPELPAAPLAPAPPPAAPPAA
jgi:hypothetical protein